MAGAVPALVMTIIVRDTTSFSKMLLITVPVHWFGSGLRQLLCHSLKLKDVVWMRAVQRPCKVSKGFFGRLHNTEVDRITRK